MIDKRPVRFMAVNWLFALAFLAGGCNAHSDPGTGIAVGSNRQESTIDVAITVDDIPSHGEDIQGLSRLQIHRQMLDALLSHHVPQVYGFFCGASLVGHDEDVAAVKAWIDAGYPLGNHTYSHPQLAEVGVERYIEDIDRNEEPLRKLTGAPDHVWKVFRYPFQFEGTDSSSRKRIQQHLEARGYRIAPVTIDFVDWKFNDTYIAALARNDLAAIAELRSRYISAAVEALHWSDRVSREIFGRRIKHVLLIHIGAFPASMTDSMLAAYEREGVRFVTLDEALLDPAYRTTPSADRALAGTFLEQLINGHPRGHAK